MKKTGIRFTGAILAFAAFTFAFAPVARAQEQTREEATALLTAGIWHFQGTNWSNDRVFDPKGRVLVQASNANGVIKWKIEGKQVNIIFSDHVDVLFLPIDPKGTKGMDQHGNDVVVTQVPGSANASAQASGTPSALDALKPVAAGAPAPAQLLTTKKWHFAGASWEETRVFDPNGTMTIENNANVAHWQVTSKQVVMTFKDHKDILFLPLDPKGTKGMDEHGRLIIATQVDETAIAPASVPKGGGAAQPASGSGSYFGTTNENGAPTPKPLPAGPQP